MSYFNLNFWRNIINAVPPQSNPKHLDSPKRSAVCISKQGPRTNPQSKFVMLLKQSHLSCCQSLPPLPVPRPCPSPSPQPSPETFPFPIFQVEVNRYVNSI